MRRGWVTAFVMNGAASIHDFEIAIAGQTSEDVEAVLPDGRFGAAEETGREMNLAIAQGEPAKGSAWARRWDGVWRRWPSRSSRRTASWHAAYRSFDAGDGARRDGNGYAAHASGRRRRGDRRGHASRFSPAVLAGARPRSGRRVSERRLRRGAAGSVSESGFGGAQSGASAGGFTTVNFDFLQHYRPKVNVVERPHARSGGRGYAITGHHEIMIPLLAAALIEADA